MHATVSACPSCAVSPSLPTHSALNRTASQHELAGGFIFATAASPLPGAARRITLTARAQILLFTRKQQVHSSIYGRLRYRFMTRNSAPSLCRTTCHYLPASRRARHAPRAQRCCWPLWPAGTCAPPGITRTVIASSYNALVACDTHVPPCNALSTNKRLAGISCVTTCYCWRDNHAG